MADIEQNIKLSADIQNAISNIQRVDTEFEKFKQQLDELSKAGKIAGREVGKAFSDAEARKYYKELQRVNKETERIEEQTRRAAQAARDYGDAASVAAREVEAFGDVGTGLSTVRGALESAGVGGPVTGALLGGAEIADSVEAFKRLGPALGDVKAKALDSLSGLASSAGGLANLGFAGGAAAAAIAGVGLALKNFSDDAKRQAEAFKAQFEARRELSQEIAGGNLTLEEAQERLEQYNRQLDASKQVYADAQAAYNQFEDSFGVGAAVLKVIDSREQALSDSVKTAREDTEQWSAKISELNRAIESGTLASENAVSAEETLNASRIAIANGVAQVEQRLLAARSQSSDQIRSQIDSLNAQVAIIQNQERSLRNAGEDTTALTQQIDILGTTALRMRNELLPAAEAQEKQAKAAEEAKKRFEEFAERLKQTREDLINATEKYNDDVKDIQQRAYEQLATAQEKYNDAQVDAAEKLADSQQDITEKLADKVAELGVDAARDAAEAQREFRSEQLDEIRDYQRDERDAIEDHQRRLRDIRRSAEAEEEDAILQRDFKRLFEIRKNTGKQLETANEEFNEEKAARERDLQERLGDIANEFAEERAIRQQEYQQQLADAQAQAQEERAQIQANYAERKAELAQNLQEEKDEIESARVEQLALRNEAIQEELALISSGYEQRLAVEAQYQQRMLQQAQSILSGGVGGLSRATGGAGLSGGFGAIGNTFNRIANNALNNTFNINNNNSQTTGQQIAGVVSEYLNRLFD